MKRAIIRAVLGTLRDDTGATLAEYALVSVTIGMAMMVGVAVLQTNAGNELTATANGWLSVATTPP